jgi:hypothetical protein
MAGMLLLAVAACLAMLIAWSQYTHLHPADTTTTRRNDQRRARPVAVGRQTNP